MLHKYSLFKVFRALRGLIAPDSVRGIAKKAKVSASASKMCLDYLLKENLIHRKIIGNVYQFTLNEDNVLLRHIKTIYSLAEIQKAGLVQELLNVHKDAMHIVLFGSAATGRDVPSSDIDILLITRRKAKIGPFPAEKKLKREVSIVKYTYSEWRSCPSNNKAFYDNIILDGTPLYGEIPIVK